MHPINYVWYLVICGAFLAIFYMLVRPYRIQAERNHPRSKRAFHRLVTAHLILWALDPIVWILANTGINVLSSGYEVMGYTLLDIASKVGFVSFYSLP